MTPGTRHQKFATSSSGWCPRSHKVGTCLIGHHADASLNGNYHPLVIVGARQPSDVWQYIHSTIPARQSIMPSTTKKKSMIARTRLRLKHTAELERED
jgi:hypothetical protein